MIAIDLPVRILIFPLASEGPSTHAPTPRPGTLPLLPSTYLSAGWWDGVQPSERMGETGGEVRDAIFATQCTQRLCRLPVERLGHAGLEKLRYTPST